MARYLNTTAFIESVKTRAMLPDTNVTFREPEFLMFANEEMDNSVVPFVHSFRQDYLLVSTDIPLERDVIRYKIPNRAVANKLRDVMLFDNSGNLYEMTRIFPEDESFFQFNSTGSGINSLRSFMTMADEIVFPDGSNVSGATAMKVLYYIRPNQLVSESRVAKIKAIDYSNNTVTIDKYPEAFGGVSTFDITSSKSPFSLIAMDIAPTILPSPTVLQMTFAELPKHISIGDIIALPEETSIPQIPVEVHSLLAQRVAMRCLEALGDTQGLQNAAAKLVEMEQKLSGVLQDRVEGAPLKVNNFHSFLRSSRRWNWRW